MGLDRLDTLISEGLIIESKDGKLFDAISRYKLSPKDTKKRVALALKMYRLEEAGMDHNWISFQTESVNDAGLKALKKLREPPLHR